MTKIRKELKNATFVYDEEKKSFYLSGKEGGFIELNKICAFAFVRFVIRMAQRNWLKSNKIIKEIIGNTTIKIGKMINKKI